MRLSRKEAAAMGLSVPKDAPGARGKSKVTKVSPEMFLALCAAHGLPAPVAEFVFSPPRKWRWDFAWLKERVALEIQGGLFVGGRHSRGAALLKEHEKLNAGAARKWYVLFCTPQDVATGKVFEVLTRALT